MYKVIIKVITNRLKTVLGDLVAPAQASFTPGQQMVDNVIVCQELINTIQRKQGRKGAMVIKLDLAKVYDSLKWSFIQDTLDDAGLPPTLVAVIMKCITSGYYRVLWNGEATDPIFPSQGLRQGDPLSPYLFVLCMERLAQWIEL